MKKLRQYYLGPGDVDSMKRFAAGEHFEVTLSLPPELAFALTKEDTVVVTYIGEDA